MTHNSYAGPLRMRWSTCVSLYDVIRFGRTNNCNRFYWLELCVVTVLICRPNQHYIKHVFWMFFYFLIVCFILCLSKIIPNNSMQRQYMSLPSNWMWNWLCFQVMSNISDYFNNYKSQTHHHRCETIECCLSYRCDVDIVKSFYWCKAILIAWTKLLSFSKHW